MDPPTPVRPRPDGGDHDREDQLRPYAVRGGGDHGPHGDPGHRQREDLPDQKVARAGGFIASVRAQSMTAPPVKLISLTVMVRAQSDAAKVAMLATSS